MTPSLFFTKIEGKASQDFRERESVCVCVCVSACQCNEFKGIKSFPNTLQVHRTILWEIQKTVNGNITKKLHFQIKISHTLATWDENNSYGTVYLLIYVGVEGGYKSQSFT